MERVQVLRVMNNNVILVKKPSRDTQFVLIGKGLGFGLKSNTIISIDKTRIEKSFLAYESNGKNAYFNLIEQLDDKIIGVCSEITLLAEKEMGKLNENLLIVLTDHISFALERIKKGMKIQNPFLYEIKSLYPKEFEIGITAKKMIKEQVGIEINDDEIAFIALHINAAEQNTDISNSLNKTRVIKLMASVIEDNLKLDIDKDLTYVRLISHFLASLDRAEKNIQIDNPLLPLIKKDFKKPYKLAEKIGEIVYEELGLTLGEGELGYLALHIHRICQIKR